MDESRTAARSNNDIGHALQETMLRGYDHIVDQVFFLAEVATLIAFVSSAPAALAGSFEYFRGDLTFTELMWMVEVGMATNTIGAGIYICRETLSELYRRVQL